MRNVCVIKNPQMYFQRIQQDFTSIAQHDDPIIDSIEGDLKKLVIYRGLFSLPAIYICFRFAI
jgi:hypothetical protein